MERLMTARMKFWVQIVAVFAVCATVVAWFGGSWLVFFFGGTLVYAIGVWVHILKYGHTTEHLWRIRPVWKR